MQDTTFIKKKCFEFSETKKATRKKPSRPHYLASLATVKKILKLHKERKYQTEVPMASQLVNEKQENLPKITKPFPLIKNDESVSEMFNEYYTIDKSNKTPSDYFNINGDVAAFARNYQRVKQIIKYTTLNNTQNLMKTENVSNANKIKQKYLSRMKRAKSFQEKKMIKSNSAENLPTIRAKSKSVYIPSANIIKLHKIKCPEKRSTSIKPNVSTKKSNIPLSKQKYANFVKTMKVNFTSLP